MTADTKTHDAVLRNLEILGEAGKRVPADVCARDEEIAWRRIGPARRARARVLGIDEDIIWKLLRPPFLLG